MASPHALLFDIDGTLVDSNEHHVSAWDEVFREAGHDFDRATLHAQVGKGGDNYVPSLLPDLPPAEQERIAQRHGEVYKARYLHEVRPFPGARDLLARARHDGLKVALASSAKGDELAQYCKLLDAADLVDAATSKDDVENSKPDPDIFAAALAKTGAPAGEALVIGDTPWDVIAAGKIGVGTIAVLSGGFSEAELREAGAVAIYRDVADLLAQYEDSPMSQKSSPAGGGGSSKG